MPDPPGLTPPDLDHADVDDQNFMSEVASGELSRAMGLLGRARFTVRRGSHNLEEFSLLAPDATPLGRVRQVQAGGWSVEDVNGHPVAMLWRAHTEDHQVDNVSSLVHLGFHRWEKARKEEVEGSLYCLANLDKTVRFFMTYIQHQPLLETPSNRVAMKLVPGASHGEIKVVDAYDEPVATIRTTERGLDFSHDVTFEELEDPFLVAIFLVSISVEMSLRHAGEWKSPFQTSAFSL